MKEESTAPGFTEIAFSDARRLGRIRLVRSPLNEPPISELGFDPILSMPLLDDLRASLSKRTCPIKALLLDQSFSAGIGNYLAGTFANRQDRFSLRYSANYSQMRSCTRPKCIPSSDVTHWITTKPWLCTTTLLTCATRQWKPTQTIPGTLNIGYSNTAGYSIALMASWGTHVCLIGKGQEHQNNHETCICFAFVTTRGRHS